MLRFYGTGLGDVHQPLTKGSVMARAGNNYKQIRITLTEERGGRFTARCMVKPLSAEWSQKHVFWHRQGQLKAPLNTTSDVYALLLDLLCEPSLPESLDG